MPAPIRVKLEGLEEVKKTLLALEAKHFRKATRKGVTAATKLVLSAARANVPKRTGMLRKSLGRKVVASKGGKGYVGIVGPRKDISDRKRAEQQLEFEQGKRKKPPKARFRKVVKYKGREILVNPVKYAHLVEYGTQAAGVKKKKAMSDGETVFGTRTAGVAPRPFLRPAWDGNKVACEAAILAAMKDALTKAGK